MRSLPDKTPKVVWSPIETYWRGLDIISKHFSRTDSYKEKDPGSHQFQEYLFWRKNLVIWTCCTIESFVNMAGVSSMGDEFYKDTTERQKIVTKIRLIYAIKYKKILPADDSTIKKVREIFELRNQFVHPKTRSVDKDADKDNRETQGLDKFRPPEVRDIVQSVNNLISRIP